VEQNLNLVVPDERFFAGTLTDSDLFCPGPYSRNMPSTPQLPYSYERERFTSPMGFNFPEKYDFATRNY
jgi:hypothetical protein